LKRIDCKNDRTTTAKVTVELNIHHEDPVSTKTVWIELHKSNNHGKATIARPLITEKTLKGKKYDVIKQSGHLMTENMLYGQMSCPSCCSQHQSRFMFGECRRKPIILNAWFHLWNMEEDLWWFRQQYHGIMLVLKLLWMVELLAVTTWTF
jgi:hypothetical protein